MTKTVIQCFYGCLSLCDILYILYVTTTIFNFATNFDHVNINLHLARAKRIICFFFLQFSFRVIKIQSGATVYHFLINSLTAQKLANLPVHPFGHGPTPPGLLDMEETRVLGPPSQWKIKRKWAITRPATR